MEKLMKLIETEDIDYIYAVFSQRIRENKDDLYEKIQEFIHFCKKNITSWDFPQQVKIHNAHKVLRCQKEYRYISFVQTAGLIDVIFQM